MDPSSETSPRPRRMRYAPGPPPPKRSRQPINTNTEAEAEEDSQKAARQISKRIGIRQRNPKPETNASSSSEVAFQPNSSWALPVRTVGVPKEDDDERGSDDVVPSSSADTPQKVGEDDQAEETEKAYVDPWGKNTDSPTVLPWRKPNSGDPELLDEEEFGKAAKHPDCDDENINSAAELGLTPEHHCKKQMLFFKIPDCLPIVKQSSGAANTKKPVAEDSSTRNNPFQGLPEGFMGKMLVYKSGAVKLKLGDVLFDVMPGPDEKSRKDVAVIDTKGRKCCVVASSAKFATVTPDVESLLSSASDMKIHK